MDDWVAASTGARDRVKARAIVRTHQARAQQEAVRVQQIRTQQAEVGVEFQQSRWSSTQQSEDKLDQEIELIRRLMVRVSEKKVAARK